MKNASCLSRTLLGILCFLFLSSPGFAQSTPGPQINGLFFYKPDCPKCEKLRRDVLPEIKQQFEDQITILSLNTADKKGGELYLNALVDLGIPFSQPLPLVIIGAQQWHDPVQIKRQLPDILKTGLAESGLAWPAISGLKDFLKSMQHLPKSEKTQWFISARPDTLGFIFSDMKAKYNHDPIGNRYAVVVLIGMLIVGGYSLFLFFRSHSSEIDFFSQWLILIHFIIGIAVTWQLAEIDHMLHGQKPFWDSFESQLAFLVLAGMIAGFLFSLWALLGSTSQKVVIWQRWSIPLLLAIGLIAASYLTYIEAAHVEAVCGAVGDCNSVQQSEYASLFGVISVGLLGILGHILILCSWIMGQFGPLQWRGKFRILLWCVLLVSVGYFIFLTFLEPFVIGSTCFWCLATAIAMTLQLFISVSPAIQAINS
ncbi:MAG: hypothetical protein HOC09_35720 [Deltaproteobacteria bacterium]|nr:hypothetical protein [Deltaproteobacteria bacterium]